MKLLSFLLVTASLILGLVAAASAYFAPLNLADEALVGLTAADTIAAPRPPSERASPAAGPIVAKGEVLDATKLGALRDAGARAVRVEEFSFARWSGRHLFLLACLGLAAGGLLGRWTTRRSIAATTSRIQHGPESTLESVDAAVAALLRRWSGIRSREAACREVIDALSPVIEEQLPAFAATRPILVSRVGLGGFAAIMDRFAAAERQLHRAWSAAADGVPEESLECLERSRELLAATRTLLAADSRAGAIAP